MVYVLGRIPDGEQTERYSKTFRPKSSVGAQFRKPIPTVVMIRAQPVSQKKNDHLPYMAPLQRPLL